MDLLQSHEIESEHTDEDEEPIVQDTHVEAVLNPGSLLSLLCANDDLINMEMGGVNVDQMEAENTQFEGQASDVFLHDDIMDLIGDYGKQSNIELVTYSQSSGSASSSDIVSTDKILCGSNDNQQPSFKMSGMLKQPIDVMLKSESAFNIPYDPSKKSHTSSVRKGISENKKRCMRMDKSSPFETKKIKIDNCQELSWICDIKGLTFECQACCCGFCNFSDFNLHGKNFPLNVMDSLNGFSIRGWGGRH